MPREVPESDPDAESLLARRTALRRHPTDGLMLEGVPLAAIARAAGTPCWVMSAGTLRGRLARLRSAMDPHGIHIHYAVKANDTLAVLQLMAGSGAGADVVSGGELQRALRAGMPPGRIVFSGVGKQPAELLEAAQAGIAQVNVESAEELDMLSAVAAAAGLEVAVALRVNPDVDAGTHAKITTGRADNKFGVAAGEAVALYAHAAALPGIRPVGLAVHIGSQIAAMAAYRAAYALVARLVRDLRGAGHEVTRVDCGGGLGISYRDEAEGSPQALAGAIAGAFGGMGLTLMVEPGRWLAGPAGLLLSRVVLTKQAGGRRFLVLDSAMNDLARPSLYDAWHGIVPVDAAGFQTHLTDVVGPVCETGDTFARQRALPALAPGACVAILDTGAYGSVMSSTYNARPLAPQVMVDGEQWRVIRRRQPVAALWADEVLAG